MVYGFQKIKEEFFVKRKIFFVHHYFTSHQTPKNTKNVFCNSFYKNKQRLRFEEILE
jgi:hypothetical protein